MKLLPSLINLINLCLCIFVSCAVDAYAASGKDIAYEALWEQYKSSFIQDDGRVIDKRQKDISHSEGQGYGMLISVGRNDKTAFNKIWRWTKDNIQSRKDNLFAWAWGKRYDEQWGIIDYNNATDGDVLIAYALLQASQKWQDNGYKTEALQIIRSLRIGLSITRENRIFLLPAYYGFNRDNGLVLNPSYMILPAYIKFAAVDDKSFWTKVHEDGRFLLEHSVFGILRLPADWITFSKTGISLNGEHGSLFGFEAIRTFLYMSWDKNPIFPEGLGEMFKFYEKLGYIPMSADLSNNTISVMDAPAGFYAVYALAAEKSGSGLSGQLFDKALKKAAAEKDDYYSLSLVLLAGLQPES